MEKIRFGSTGLMVSKIAFGGIPIERLTLSDAADLVRKAVDMGINFFDTAHGYTDSEEKMGLGFKGVPREEIIIASKSPARDKKTFLEHLDLTLSRLGTDYVDIYQHHGISTMEDYEVIMGEGGAFEGMTEAIKDGKIRFPAFSSHDVDVSMEIMKKGHFKSVQLPLNYVEDEAVKAVHLAKELDIGFIAMKPFGGGRLDDASLAIKYLMQFDHIVPDPGIEKLHEIEEIIRIVNAAEALTDDEITRMQKIKSEMEKEWCRQCDYCRPCPQNIEISRVLMSDRMHKRLPHVRVMKFISAAMENAKSCTACGECKPRCPYHLDIPKQIKEKLILWDEYLAEHQ